MAIEEIPARPRRKRRSKWVKAGYASAGAALFATGAVGIVTPGLPTTIFWILATVCLLKANPGAVRPILRTPMIGPLIKRFVRWRPFGGGKKVRRSGPPPRSGGGGATRSGVTEGAVSHSSEPSPPPPSPR